MGAKECDTYGKRGGEYGIPDWSDLDLNVLPPEHKKPSPYNPVRIVRSWYESYKIMTAIYMLEPWEEVLLNVLTLALLFILATAFSSLLAYLGLISGIAAQ